MADWVDRAVQREELELARAISAQLAIPKPTGPSLPDCISCGDEIPAKRQALGGITRCTPCQAIFEQGNRR